MKKILLFIFLLFLFSFKHPFYLGVVDLKYNEKEKALQGSVKLFTNDLESALKKIHNQTVDLIHPKDKLKTDQLLEQYIRQRLSFQVNNKKITYKYLGFELEQEAVWIYIELSNCPPPKKVELENSLLYDFLSAQSNIVHLEVKGQRKSYKVENPDKIIRFDF